MPTSSSCDQVNNLLTPHTPASKWRSLDGVKKGITQSKKTVENMSRVMLSKSNSSTSSALLSWWDNARWYRNCLSFTTSGLLNLNSERWRYKMWQGTTLANFPILRIRIPLKIYLNSNMKSCAINNQVRMLCNNSKSKHRTSFIGKELRWTVNTIPSTMKLDSLTQHRA